MSIHNTLLILIFLLISCTDEINNSSNNNIIEFNSGLFEVGFNQTLSGPNKGEYYVLLGFGIYLTDIDSIGVDGGKLTISNAELNFKQELGGSKGQTYGSFYYTKENLPIIPEFGTISKWGLSGNNKFKIKSFYRNYYVINKIELFSPLPQDTIDKDRDLIIDWEPELNIKDSLYIWIYKDDPNFVESYFSRYVQDNGQYIIRVSDLSIKSDKIIISITRSSKWSDIIDGRLYYFRAYSWVNGEYIVK